jgi:Homing endonuclease associated repeat
MTLMHGSPLIRQINRTATETGWLFYCEENPVPEIKPTEHNSPERDFNLPSFHELPKEEVILLLKKAAKELGKVPTFLQFRRLAGATPRTVARLFGGYRELIQAAGFEPLGAGFRISMEKLFADWARVTRKLGKVPSQTQYCVNGKHSHRAFYARWNSWRDIPAAMIEYASANRLLRKWDDVIKLAKKYVEQEKRHEKARKRKAAQAGTAQPVAPKRELGAAYGRPMMHAAMMTMPVNEAGVMVLFGAMAVQLGFAILRLQEEFPDCEALRLCRDGRWRWVRIEFEFESRNFRAHGHDKNGCDLIVCWKHNWLDCPVEVMELSKMVMSN